MAFNVVMDAWLPVRRRSGGREVIPPWRLTDALGPDPIQTLDFPRADFNGGAVQFLIGLLQTCLMPESPRAWRKLRTSPPAPEELRAAFEREADAFCLDGDGPRFMQDLTLSPKEAGDPKPVSALLIDAPGENALERNTDFFVKRGQAERLCPACAAAALFTLQANAPAGGVGYRTSLRGGGPLTTLVLGENLWDTVWLNVLDADGLRGLGDPSKPRKGGIFPWLAPTVTSETKGARTVPLDVHPLHMYWSMPRRIRLHFEDGPVRPCGLCDSPSALAVAGFLAKNYGYNYEGGFQHPLTPYARKEGEEPYSVKGSPIGVQYRHWCGLVDETKEAKTQRSPARVVQAFRKAEAQARRQAGLPDYRVWAFGYDMDNMKARAWVEAVVPVYEVPEGLRQAYGVNIGRLVDCAGLVCSNLRQAVKRGLFPEGKDIKVGNSILGALDARFWAATEPAFYATLRDLRDALEADGVSVPAELKLGWLKALAAEAERLFNEYAMTGEFAAEDPKRVALAWRDLRVFSAPSAKKVREALDLPIEPDKDGKRKPAAKAAKEA
jgi:CRISPR system Cascade subunit CasA